MSIMVKRVAQALQQEMGTAAFDEATIVRSGPRRHHSDAGVNGGKIDGWIRAPGAIKGGWQGMIDAALGGK